MAEIAVIIPVFNGEAYLKAAIESILVQTPVPREIIVIDDGSTDQTGSVARSLPVTYLRRERTGSGAAKNYGIAQAQSEILTFLDADDLWLPEKMSLQLETMQSNPELEATYGLVEQFYSPELGITTEPPHRILEGMYLTLMIRKEAFNRVGPFATDRIASESVEWCARALEKKLRTQCIPRILARRRIHKTNTGVVHKDLRAEYLSIVRQKITNVNLRETNIQ